MSLNGRLKLGRCSSAPLPPSSRCRSWNSALWAFRFVLLSRPYGSRCDGAAVRNGDVRVHGHRGLHALLDDLGAEAYKEALTDHRRTLRGAFGARWGYEVDDAGDGLFYAFASASEAVMAVEQAMASLADGPVRVRVGMHTGEPLLDPPKYVGPDVHKAARIISAAHGGQVLLSGATR